jgi:2-polyprenyl-6-methoxyphenol hydroxylase-like FAD-dependent oxidoreductase
MADQAPGAETADVVIVGAGPTGLMLAIELCLASVRPVILERLTAISEIPKGNGLVGDIVPALDHRGLLDRLLGKPAPADALLIRPDGYVAWASGPGDADPAAGLRDALTAWCRAGQAGAG